MNNEFDAGKLAPEKLRSGADRICAALDRYNEERRSHGLQPVRLDELPWELYVKARDGK